MAFSLKQKIDSFFFALLLVSTINFGFIILAENKAKTHLDWVIHSYKVIDDSEKLLQYLIDAETGQRGFLLIQNREYLQPYISGKEKSLSKFSSLNLLTYQEKKKAYQNLVRLIC
jgi:CHASE3 domain sensor protein